MKFQNVKGTRDFFPDDMARRNWLIDAWRQTSRRHGFVEYDGPTFEYLDLYKAKSGEGIVSELFHFEDRGGRQLALRPEMTPTFARMVAARAQTLPKPIKWFCVPNFFRAERPQRGRLREFWQWNADIVTAEGDETRVADVECIFVALDLLRGLGLSASQVEMRISSREMLAQVLVAIGIQEDAHAGVYAAMDKRAKVPEEVFVEELQRAGLDSDQKDALIELGSTRGEEGLAIVEKYLGAPQGESSPLGQLRWLFDQMQSMGVGDYCRFDPSVVRGLAYYTGVIFEAYGLGTLNRAVLGGGRYGQLLSAMGGQALTGVGFGMGDVVLLEHLAELDMLPEPAGGLDFFVALEKDTAIEKAIQLVGAIRAQGRSALFSYKPANLKKQMQQANAHKARYVVIIGHLDDDSMALKHFESGSQVELARQAFTAALAQRSVASADPVAELLGLA